MIDLRHVFPSIICLSIGVGIIIFLTSGCRSSIPRIDVSLWAGDPAKDGISRSQEQRTMSCQSAEFAQMACLTYSDLKKIYSTMLLCEKWGSVSMNSSEAKKFVKKNQDVLIKAVQSPREVFPYEEQRREIQYRLESVDD